MNSQKVLVNLRNLAFGGEAVGEVVEVTSPSLEKYLGITAFVSFSVPGERVWATIEEDKGSFLKCNLLEIAEPSHHRTEPLCPYYMQCGGCDIQHVTYNSSLQFKQAMIHGALRSAKLPSAVLDLVTLPIKSEPYGYRRRIQLHIDGSGAVGFYRKNSRSVVGIEDCKIADSDVSTFISKVREVAPILKGKCNACDIEKDKHGILLTFTAPYELSTKDIKDLHDALKKHFNRYLLLHQGKDAGGLGSPFLELPLKLDGRLSFKIPGGSFSQVNWEINLKLLEFVTDVIGSSENKNVYDLYAGAGNFTLPIASTGKRVTAVECDTRLVASGRESAKRLGLEQNINYIEGSVESFLKKNTGKKDLPIVILDPPRSGLKQLVNDVKFAKEIILISCHLSSFVRDLKNLVDLGYNVQAIQPFDMFPQTSYVEVVSVLRK
jgi:23S rRNA (uracil1939-C5)-methyltransferase